MTVRVSTSGQHYRALNALLDAQARLSRTQEQVATGRRIVTPADDPIGATRIQDLARQISASEQYLRNNDVARSRLELEEQALADVSTSLNRIRELVVQASNDTVDDSARGMIREEVLGRVAELLDIANRKDAQGEYLFAGLSVQTQPYARVAGVVQYFGDQGQRLQQVGTAQQVGDTDSGYEVFGRIAAGNGTFVTAAGAANTGSGSISVGTLVDRASWTGANYTLRFTAPASWEVVDSAVPTPNVVASGAYVPGESITFAGISVAVQGAPATGDRFTVGPAGKTDLFKTLDALVATLGTSTATSAGRGQFRTGIEGALGQLDQANEHVLDVRARVGVRLDTLDNARSAQEDAGVVLETLLSDVRDLDYAEAITRLNVQYASLQAAQKSLASVAQLSLFDYL